VATAGLKRDFRWPREERVKDVQCARARYGEVSQPASRAQPIADARERRASMLPLRSHAQPPGLKPGCLSYGLYRRPPSLVPYAAVTRAKDGATASTTGQAGG